MISVAAVLLASNGGVANPGSSVGSLKSADLLHPGRDILLVGSWGAFLGLLAILGITITGPFGIVITPHLAGLLAGFMSSYSELLAAVAFYIC